MANVQPAINVRPGGQQVWYSDTNPGTLSAFGPPKTGDFCFNIGVLTSDVGWLCTTGGSSPGVWEAAGPSGGVQNVAATVTIAQINAGYTLVAAVTGRTITVTNFWMKAVGNFTSATDVRLSDTAGTPVDVVTVVVANFQTGNLVTPAGGTGITIGTFAAPLTISKGLQLRQTGSAITVATSAIVTVSYVIS